MKAIKFIAVIAIVLLTSILINMSLISCSTEKITAYENVTGAQLWGQNCIRCHNTPSPASYNDTDWNTIGLHMRVRANLTEKQANKIFDFIKSAN
jgi:mono/diheme cytochrome c family protein